jgi:3-hydroxybutyryl-CoA dehydrogenase
MSVERVFVAGAGLMGHGIAQVHAAVGKRVALYEPDLGRAIAGRDRIAGNLDRSVAKGRSRGPGRRRVPPTTSPCRGRRPRRGCVEDLDEDSASRHRPAPRRDLRLEHVDRHRSRRGDRRAARALFLGMHFFSPVPVMPDG